MEAGKRILVVEDNPSDEFLTLEAFNKLGLGAVVLAARDGAEALDYLFGSSGFVPELILLDLSLPSLNGIEVLDRIRADTRTQLVPVVVFTGSESRRDLVASYLNGANSFVQKPMEFSQYAEVLRQIWDYWSKVNVAPTPPALQVASTERATTSHD